MIQDELHMPSWIHTLADYKSIFALKNKDLDGRILEFPATLSSVNVQLTTLGKSVVSASPFYAMESDLMPGQVKSWMTQLLEALPESDSELPGEESWCRKRLQLHWQRVSEIFVRDYPIGKREGRYQFAGDVHLPFSDRSFDIALCADLQNEHDDNLRVMLVELLRVAKEVRFLLALKDPHTVPSWLQSMLATLHEHHCSIELKAVPSLVCGGQWAMLKVSQLACLVPANTA